MNRIKPICLALFLASFPFLSPAADKSALSDAVILIIRHAEKPASGPGLAPEGVQRAEAYVNYFKNLKIDSQPIKLDALIATADSKSSKRPRLTLTPLSQALNLPLDTAFKDKEYDKLAEHLQKKPPGKNILICWHHGAIPNLLDALGADSEKLLPKGKWPDGVFGWLIELRYDHEGRLLTSQCKRINEHLMPDDSLAKAME